MNNTGGNISADIENISRISIVPVILEGLCRITGMGFAAVARVTEERWIACGVHDDIRFGLKVGGELKVDTTICHEIRQSGEGVIIDHVAEDEVYCLHHTPAMYGFQSYISIPIARKDGRFFGTLCAIDPNPAVLRTPAIIGMFKTYAELISFHLNAVEELPAPQVQQLEEVTNAYVREQLAAILGSVVTKDSRSKEFAGIIERSSSQVKELIGHLKLQVAV